MARSLRQRGLELGTESCKEVPNSESLREELEARGWLQDREEEPDMGSQGHLVAEAEVNQTSYGDQYQIIMLYTLNEYSVLCQLNLNLKI